MVHVWNLRAELYNIDERQLKSLRITYLLCLSHGIFLVEAELVMA